ncbi:DNA-binding protein [Pectobacterium zantedeschiae]|uniref:Cro/Cl family transcriptional regulator n=1 Tax=Pectobacterium zantedeschiae TaxID=2034769 RepID=A0A9X8JMH9_9GAMM|nr:DNA-binding protein [Pectobacterium zantedeschiae]RYC37338.1 Cro/Cl family transcriptional regulator [Pectobacterium zantedeschiae]RYC42586.1 Cro/Cl family transcriptional regulator [Pectobacterium zantedeschiae]RYC45824.1 Cro/Cl family transcriptional regulator [Pectobacterium zantedeschiae]RYC47121.1 Cro/Cl family transcriptional regulator [Pectobacterium zantedeschiae]
MDKEWFATSELVGVGGLPKSPQGLNKRARDDGWEKRRRKGVQGRGVEYSIRSLPNEVRNSLLVKENSPTEYYCTDNEPTLLSSWVHIFHQLSVDERSRLINFILREGTIAMLSRLDDVTIDQTA